MERRVEGGGGKGLGCLTSHAMDDYMGYLKQHMDGAWA